MTEEKLDLPGGSSSPDVSGHVPLLGEPSGEFPILDPPADPPPVSLLASGSHDEDFFAPPPGPGLAEAGPDPILGRFVTPGPETSAGLAGSTPASDATFPTINFDAPPAHPGRGKPDRTEDDRRADEEDEAEFEERRTAWATVLLASYASAITLALVWTMLKDRALERTKPAPDADAGVPPASARQAALSRKVEPPEPILGDHFARLGEPLKLGSLEVTPTEVKRENVVLQKVSTFNNTDRREGGKKALVLRLKLRNTSTDEVFAPLDQAYLRERGKEVVDTFVEAASGDKIYPYRLAVDSELSIVGQDLSELRPGESRTVAIVSAPDAPPDSAGPFTWRVRLRTGINRTDVVGVRWPDKADGPGKAR